VFVLGLSVCIRVGLNECSGLDSRFTAWIHLPTAAQVPRGINTDPRGSKIWKFEELDMESDMGKLGYLKNLALSGP
jgi:hypothetical protein